MIRRAARRVAEWLVWEVGGRWPTTLGILITRMVRE